MPPVKLINSFYACIDMGDLVYSLLFCKLLNVKTLYIDGGCGTVKFDWKSAEFLLPLIQSQPYLNVVELHHGQSFDCNYGLHPEDTPVVPHTNLLSYHASKFGIKSNDYNLNNDTWLKANSLSQNDLFIGSKKFLINRTPRYHGDGRFYHYMLNLFPIDFFLFAGLESEYLDFRNEFNVSGLDFAKTSSSIDLLNLVESIPTFIGNESLICAIAKGLGKNCYVEYGRYAANYIFNRQNISYF